MESKAPPQNNPNSFCFARNERLYRSLPMSTAHAAFAATEQCALNDNCEVVTAEEGATACNINDCLQDLDDYLDEIDTKSLNSNDDEATNEIPQRKHPFRKTIDASQLASFNNKVPKNQNDRRCNSVTELSSLSSNYASTVELHKNEDCSKMLTPEHIFKNFLNDCNQTTETRPRQFGRRASGLPTILALRDDNTNSLVLPSVDSTMLPVHETNDNHLNSYDRQRMNSSLDSSISSVRNTVSLVSDSDSSSLSVLPPHVNFEEASTPTIDMFQQQTSSQSAANRMRTISNQNCNRNWPHPHSQFFSLLSCTLGLFNICRFSLLVANYRGNFILQFLLLSILFGIPLLWLQMCLGGKIKSGPVSMWKISPICKGIGISLLLIQFLTAIYSSVSLTWIFIYIRNSFPNNDGAEEKLYKSFDTFLIFRNSSEILSKELGEYFNVDVLQRFVSQSHNFQISDRLAFYLAILWTIVYLILCKGLKSFGRVTYALTTIPIVILIVITIKLLSIVDLAKLQNIFSSNELDDFLINSHTWVAAAQETFLTWGFLGPSVISITSRTHTKAGKYTLHWNAIFVVVITFVVLTLAAVLGLCALQILHKYNFVYIPGAYDRPENYVSIFYRPTLSPELLSQPTKYISHYSSYVGETFRRPYFAATFHQHKNGYQALRFLNEIFPAIRVFSRESFNNVWVVCTLIMFLLFGLAQLCIIWKPISSALGEESMSSVLLSCVTGLLLSIPFAAESGLQILHYFDLLFGASWIVPLLWTMFIFGIFLVRGRPYNGDELVNDLKMSTTMSSFLALSWNILLPIGLIFLTVIDYKFSNSNQFFHLREKSNFSFWSRKLGGILQVFIILLVPTVAIIQIFRYLSRSSTDLFERIQLLCRPKEGREPRPRPTIGSLPTTDNNDFNASTTMPENAMFHLDSPPKYTPPPSFSTATGGARLAKYIRRSIRRSVRRLRIASAEYTRAVSIGSEHEMIIPDIPISEQTNLSLNTFNTCDTDLRFPPPPPPPLVRSFSARRPNSSTGTTTTTTTASRSIATSLTNIADINSIPKKGSTQALPLPLPPFSRSIDNLTQNVEPTSQSLPPTEHQILNNNVLIP